ncbi:hypothetical protein F5Y16DRAFT_422879 [Xylariaceae sp. FL0255]|nr:hypothetical protein F5Y16DRAFT_422879 [Xylariaceae sp. FL0255]
MLSSAKSHRARCALFKSIAERHRRADRQARADERRLSSSSSSSTSSVEAHATSELVTHFQKHHGRKSDRFCLPYMRPGFYFEDNKHPLGDHHDAVLSKALRLTTMWSKSKARVQALLFEIFNVAFNMRHGYDVAHTTRDSTIRFFADVTTQIQNTGVDGGGLVYHGRLWEGQINEGDLSALEPDTIHLLVSVHVEAREEFLRKQNPVDKTEERLVFRQPADKSATDDAMDKDNDNGDTITTEEYEEEDLFVEQESQEVKMTKKDQKLVALVGRWIAWVNQQKGEEVDVDMCGRIISM